MMIRKELTEISRSYEAVGFNERTEKPRLRGILYSFTVPFLIVNEITYILYNWDNLENRANGLKGLLLYLICTMYLVSTLFMWKKTKLLIKIIEEGRYKFPFRSTKIRADLERKIQDDVIRLNTAWYYILVCFIGSGILTSVIVFLVKTIRHGIETITAEMLYLPFPFYYPKNYNNLFCYLLSFLMQLFFYIQLCRNAYLIAVGSYICMKLMEGDLKLLGLSLEEMDSLIRECSATIELSGFNSKAHDTHTTTIGTKIFLTYFVRHHYDIQRKVKEATEAMKLMAFSLSSGMSLMICMTIYILVKGNVVAFKIQECCFCFSIVYSLYCLDLMGDNISNEDNNLRHGLYQSAWIDKPLWFKKSLLIIMARTSRTIEIKSMGMFTLSLKSFVMTLQAAYSFYNMLINVNNDTH